MYIASLWIQDYAPEVTDFVYICDNQYTSEQIVKHTFEMLKAINGLLYVPGLDKAVEKLSGKSQVSKMLKNMRDFNELVE
jgi:hypothetical protein